MELNKIYQGDALDELKKIDDNSIDLVILDPPYNIGIDEWDKMGDTVTYLNWFEKIINELLRVTKRTASLYLFGDYRFIADIKVLMNKKQVDLISWIIWDKGSKEQNAIRSYANVTEHILFYARKDDNFTEEFIKYVRKHRHKKKLTTLESRRKMGLKIYKGCGNAGWLWFETGRIPTEEEYIKLKEVLGLDNNFDSILDRYTFNHQSIRFKRNPRDKRKFNYEEQIMPNVWYYNDKLEMAKYHHPTVKPIEMIRTIIKASSDKGDIVLDPCMGSGTTAVACKQLGRKYICIEKEQKYINIAKKRLAQGVLI